MDRKELMELFNKKPRICVLSTANSAHDVNAAVFGSAQMVDENTIVMGVGKNRTFRNLQENPKAVFIIVEPGQGPMDWKGARVYVQVAIIDSDGAFLQQIKEKLLKAVGPKGADMVSSAVKFNITEVRPILDRG
jgi:hypothetical protein